MNLIPDIAVFQKRLGALPLATYTAGETVLVAGSRTGRLVNVRNGPCRIVSNRMMSGRVYIA